jgi:hypothetical protein
VAEAHGIELSLQRENWSRGPGRSPGPFLCESHRPERKREQRNLTIDLLRRMIANSIQEEVFGTLDRATLKLLDGLARRDGARRGERNLKIGTVATITAAARPAGGPLRASPQIRQHHRCQHLPCG